MKKLLSIILTVCLIISVCSVTALAADTTNKNSFIICPQDFFQKVYFYATDSEGNQLNGDFPGTEVSPTGVNSYGEYEFSVEYPENTTYVIVNDGKGHQTEVINVNDIVYGEVYFGGGMLNDQGHFLVDYMIFTGAGESTKIGDVNGDKNVDVLDAAEIQKFSVEKTSFDKVQKKTADFNFDGNVDALDATAIQKALVSK